MRLVACPNCHTQYDVSHVAPDATVECRCGEKIDAAVRAAVDAPVERCGSCGALIGAGVDACDFCGSEIIRDRDRLSLLCPECYGRNAEAARFCGACGLKFSPEPLPSTGLELACIDCGKGLVARAVGGVSVQECPECNGIWAAMETFDELVNRAVEARMRASEPGAKPVDPRQERGNPLKVKVKYRSCPVCCAHMARRNWRKSSGVIVDVCRDHGTWLDSDELEQIAGFVLSGGWEQANRRDEGQKKPKLTSGPNPTAEFTKILMDTKPRPAGARVLESFVDFLTRILESR